MSVRNILDGTIPISGGSFGPTSEVEVGGLYAQGISANTINASTSVGTPYINASKGLIGEIEGSTVSVGSVTAQGAINAGVLNVTNTVIVGSEEYNVGINPEGIKAHTVAAADKLELGGEEVLVSKKGRCSTGNESYICRGHNSHLPN